MNKWLLLILGIVSILLLSYLSFKEKADIIKEDLLNKADIIHQHPAFKDVYVKLEGENFSLTRELTLLGTVSSEEESRLASNLLQEIEGVTHVNNLLKVQTVKPIIKEIKSIESEKTPDEIDEEQNETEESIVEEIDEENNASSELNSTQAIDTEKNLSKEKRDNNITFEQNTTQATLIKSIETNLTNENNESNQSSCQKQIEKLFVKNKINFAYNSSNIAKNSYPQLNQISTILQECSPKRIIIDGYTDNSGRAKYNQLLSQQRAEKVKAYLISKGIAKDSIKAFGHGAKNPLASNATKEGREKNRRIEFTIKGTK